jgi:hypothetical protein
VVGDPAVRLAVTAGVLLLPGRLAVGAEEDPHVDAAIEVAVALGALSLTVDVEDELVVPAVLVRVAALLAQLFVVVVVQFDGGAARAGVCRSGEQEQGEERGETISRQRTRC